MKQRNSATRRAFLGAPAAFSIIRPEMLRGSANDPIKAGLIGCGGRGSQAVIDLLTAAPNVELHAMADLFEDKLEQSLNQRMQRDRRYEKVKDRIKVAPDHKFMGLEAYKRMMASDVDVVLLTTPPGWRPIHFEAAVEAGKHVFAEKPIATDPAGCRKWLAAAKKAEEKKLTVMSGAQNRSAPWRIDTVREIQEGAIGDIVALYAYYLVDSPVFHAKERLQKWGDMEWQHRNWYSFVWLCGDQIVEQHFHNIDYVNWVMGAHPVKVVASGGCAWRPREELYGNIYDHMSSEFEYANGVRLSSHCRQYPPGSGYRRVGETIVGTKGRRESVARPQGMAVNPQEEEHRLMVESILGVRPYINHGQAMFESTLTCIMARESAYSGIEVTWDMILNSQQDLMPKALGWEGKIETPELPVPGKYKFS
jgi:predicted dehydrogenase